MGGTRYAIEFLLIGLAFTAALIAVDDMLIRVAFPWTGICFMSIGVAYALRWPGIFAKRKTGRIHPIACLVHWPFFLSAIVAVAIGRLTGRRAPFTEITPTIILGGRFNLTKLPEVQAVLDFCGEFSCVHRSSATCVYLSLPLLDGTAPSVAMLHRAVTFMSEQSNAGVVYVHCASGHGRSATAVAAYLFASHQANTPEDAVQMIKQKRPGVGLNRAQMAALSTYGDSHSNT